MSLSGHPNCRGTQVALATLERHAIGTGAIIPPARITLDLGAWRGPLAVFGPVGELRITGCGRQRLLARDLLGSEAMALPMEAYRSDGSITLAGGWLNRVGTAAASPGDPSGPGLLIDLAP